MPESPHAMSGPRSGHDGGRLLDALPPVRAVGAGEVAARIAGGPRLVVLDDDPTGTQTVAGVPVLTGWSVDDLRWALRQECAAFFVLTNTRSLAPADAAARNREIVRALHEAAGAEGIGYVIASRGDSTLRGHFPLETDVLADELAAVGAGAVDGVVVVPAYIEAGRITVGSVHWMRTADGLLPVGRSEFARDATFGYRNSDLREWVAEKNAWPRPGRRGPSHHSGRSAAGGRGPRGGTRQLERVRACGGIAEFELDVRTLLDSSERERHIARVSEACAAALDEADVVVRTSRNVVVGGDAEASLAIARQVSSALVQTVQAITAARHPAFVVAKGGHHRERYRHRGTGRPPGLGTRHAASRDRVSLGARVRRPVRRLRRERRRR